MVGRLIEYNLFPKDLPAHTLQLQANIIGSNHQRVLGVKKSNHVDFIIAESKVSPLKLTSISRLELCGVLLVADLLVYVVSIFSQKFNIPRIFAWTDFSIVLSQIKSLLTKTDPRTQQNNSNTKEGYGGKLPLITSFAHK